MASPTPHGSGSMFLREDDDSDSAKLEGADSWDYLEWNKFQNISHENLDFFLEAEQVKAESKVLNLVSVNSSGHFPLFSELSPVAFFSLGHLASQVVTSFFFLHFFTVQFLVAVFFSLSGCCFPAVSRDSLLLTSSKQTYLSPSIVMASSKSSSQEASSSNANEFSGNAENSVLLLTRHKLTGQNYLHWSRSMIMFITGKGKEDYLTISTKPQPDDPKFKTWNAENQMVMSWLINSMDLEIGQDFMFFASAAEIWKAAKESYSDVENTAELFEIKGALHDLKQDAETYKKLVEKERIYKFLLGLNKSLDNIRGRILSVKPLPSLREVLSTVRHEESRKKLMLGSLADSDSVNGSALAIHGASHNPGSGQKKGRPWCDHCHRTGHVKDKCWKLHGKPSDWKSLKDKNIASGLSVSDPKESSSSAVFSKEQMANYKVRIADGSLADVTGIGEVSLFDSITLKSVLFVPKLKCNLLSVAKLAHDSNCKAEFTHSSCSFQDVDSGKMIGNARVREDLYRFEMNKEVAPNKQSFAAGKKEDSLKEDRDIMFCHVEPSPVSPDIPESEKELKVYSRRKKDSQAGGDEEKDQEGVDETGAEIEDPMHCQDTPSDPHSHEKGNTDPNLAISDVCPDEILSPPIAKRKGVRSCTLHPISQFVSYEKLSPKFQAFVSNLDKERNDVVLINNNEVGTLMATNFRLLFVSEKTTKIIALGTIPIATIEKFCKITVKAHSATRQSDKTSLPRLLQIIGKDMRIIVFGFQPHTKQRRLIFDELLRLTKPARLWDLYAFVSGSSRLKSTNPKVRLLNEYFRLLGRGSYHASMNMIESGSFTLSNDLWRISSVNSKYTVCPTYPFAFIIPKSISDDEVNQASNFRARCRLPVVSWCHPGTGAVLARSSQPLVGLMMNMRSNADEKLVAALCSNLDDGSRR
ncbi:phosphatidylinositol-3-phosphatase myotubularin-1-like [Senna tora]|uniref:Phosphatidylinositol-3-phosphatase myotubularin-1-like n=1 Tax=Senna tora TaxID=362788 RepID=A0A834W7S1_9FABA|nr:phosphatidylinositol-3-phosphatase myotubularin-1-like [Senna tora]